MIAQSLSISCQRRAQRAERLTPGCRTHHPAPEAHSQSGHAVGPATALPEKVRLRRRAWGGSLASAAPAAAPFARRIALAVIAVVLLGGSGEAPAATIYSNLQDIAIPTGFTGVYLDLDTGATAGSAFTGWDINPFFGGTGIGNSAAFQPARVAGTNLDAIIKLNAGNLISGSLTFSTGIGGSGNTGHEHIGAGAQQFQVGTEGYLGFKFTKNDASGPYYGWMRVVLANNTAGALIKDWGYDNVSGGAIVAGRVQQSAPSAGAQLVTLSPGTGESFSLGSAITNTGGNINSVLKTGAGTTTLSVANSFTGATTVSGGTLEAATAGALGSTSGITVNTGGTLLVGGSGNRIGDTAAITLAGGTFKTAGLSETVGALTLMANSIIDFGAGASVVVFADSTGSSWGANRLSIYNWSGNPFTGGGADQLRFLGSGLTASQLAQIDFFSDAGITKLSISPAFTANAFIGFTGEVVPVPEPSSVLLAAGMIGMACLREWRRSDRLRRAGRGGAR